MTARQLRLAQILSVLGHPFVLVPLTILLSFAPSQRGGRLFAVLAVFIASTILPLFFIIRRKVSTKEWTDADVSNRQQRQHFYYFTLGILALSIPIAWLLRMPAQLITGTIVSLALLGAGLLINTRLKISMHMMFAAYCAVILARAQLAFLLCALAVLFALAWSRLVLRRHTLSEIIFGLLLGATAGLVFQWLIQR
jgi:membrane-associated phospholipid phosphatase